MIKKLSLVILTLLLCVSSVFASAANSDKVNVLTGLGILEEDYSEKKSVTLQEFLGATVNMMSETEISPEKIYENAVVYGLIKKAEAMELQGTLKFERALNIALNAMGYTHMVEMTGNNINSVIENARAAGLLDEVSGKIGENISGEAVINLLYNMLEAPIYDVNITGGKVQYKLNKDKTVLSYFRKISVVEGYVTATSSTSDSSANGLEEGMIAIGDEVYECEFDYNDEIIGLPIEAYVYDAEGDGKVLYITVNSKKTERIEISAENIDNIPVNFSYIEYADGNKIKKLNLNPALKVVYNGKLYEDYTKEDLMPESGSITLIDCDGDRKFDYIHVKSYKIMVVSNISVTYKTITNKYSYDADTASLDLSDDELDVRYYKDGGEIAFSDIKNGDVLNIAASKGKEDKILNIYVSSNVVTGTVTGKNDTEKQVTIGDVSYPVSYIYYEAKDSKDKNYLAFDIAQEQSFYLDCFGAVVYVSGARNSGYEYVYMLKHKYDESEEKYFIKSLNTDNEWETLYFDSKVGYNDEGRKDVASVYKKIVNSGVTSELVLIKKNADGLITNIKFPEETTEYEPNKFIKQPTVSRYYWTSNQTLDYYEYIKNDVIVFTTPSADQDAEDTDLYTVESASYFRDWGNYTYNSYNEDEFGYPEVLVMKGYNASSGARLFVNDVIEVASKDGGAVKAVICNVGGILDLRVPEKMPGIIGNVQPGDIISASIRDGVIISCTVQYSLSQGKAPGISGYVYNTIEYKGNVISFDAERRMVLIDCGTAKIPMKIDTDVSFNIWDSEKEKFDAGNFYDLEKGDFAFVYGGSSDIQTIVVYK